MFAALREHWPEYLMEGAGLCIFMISTGAFSILLEHPTSPIKQAVSDPSLRLLLRGAAMGLTIMGIIYSPWGKQSGAHINPSITLAFLRLGKVEPWDAVFYVAAQFAGGLFGVGLAAALVGHLFTGPPVNYAATMPGAAGPTLAFLVELVVSFLLMVVVLTATNVHNLARFTGLFAGIFIAAAFSLAAPLSGMSINPARTFASALPAHLWTAFWVYFTAPPLGMLLAAEIYLRVAGDKEVACAKLHHENKKRCIFRCGYKQEL